MIVGAMPLEEWRAMLDATNARCGRRQNREDFINNDSLSVSRMRSEVEVGGRAGYLSREDAHVPRSLASPALALSW